ncbi:MAG: hypothetical protein KAJ91_03105 [Candidatus Aenigmarchaeota archaeon]|nr:hypothetical protein [Candidatus Aenigmarchaeota archaeon]
MKNKKTIKKLQSAERIARKQIKKSRKPLTRLLLRRTIFAILWYQGVPIEEAEFSLELLFGN